MHTQYVQYSFILEATRYRIPFQRTQSIYPHCLTKGDMSNFICLLLLLFLQHYYDTHFLYVSVYVHVRAYNVQFLLWLCKRGCRLGCEGWRLGLGKKLGSHWHVPAHVSQDPKRHVEPQTARRRNTKTTKCQGEEMGEKEKQRGVKLRQLGLGPSIGQGLRVSLGLG